MNKECSSCKVTAERPYMRLLDIVTIEEIVCALEGNTPSEGMGKQSFDDLKPLCKALVNVLFRDALAKVSVAPPSRLRRIWLAIKRRYLRTRWGSMRAVKDVPTMMNGIQMVDVALRKKWRLRRAEPRLKM